MKQNFRNLMFVFILLCANISYSQIYNSYQNNGFDPITRNSYNPGMNLHTSVKPYRLDEIENHYSTDSLVQRDLYKPYGKLNIFQRFVHDDLFRWEDKEDIIMVRVNPLFNFEFGKELSEERNLWVNTRGIMIEGQLGKNVAFFADFYENQAVFPQYIDDYISDKSNPSFPRGRYVVPGQGSTIKRFKETGWDYYQSTGYVSYNAGQYINFHLGYGKNFLGDGYRSLLLSDNATAYTHFKMTTTFWKVKYWWMIAQFQHRNYDEIGELTRYPYKYGAFHYLTWNIGKRLSFGLFESVIWAEKDKEGHRGIDLNYINPFLFYRPVENAIGSPDNMFLGANIKLIIAKGTALYSQFIINEFKLDELKARNGWWANKWGVQVGAKSYNIFRINNLDIQSEINIVRPFTYTWYNPINNYGHATQPLAHPLGANFRENVSIIRYRWKRWHIEMQSMIAIKGEDKNIVEALEMRPNDFENRVVSYGGDIYKSNQERFGSHGHNIGQGYKTDIRNLSAELSWLINPKNNMNIAIGGRYRTYSNEKGENVNKIFYVTLRTSLRNIYYDF
ncbi:MAG: hypothetical protein FWH18_10930 [Marinilabiliaceae bacterium]|nr:hypothetical protein [Marinilabiliaceae bacterium]